MLLNELSFKVSKEQNKMILPGAAALLLQIPTHPPSQDLPGDLFSIMTQLLL